jgi:outer membrane protein assembly factor BamB
MNRCSIKLFVIGIVGLLLSCSSDRSPNYVYRGNLSRSGVLEYSEIDMGYRSLLWVKDFGLEISSEPMIMKDNLYFGSLGSVVSYNLESQTVNWLNNISGNRSSYIIATPVTYLDSLLIVCPNFETGRFKQEESSVLILSKISGKRVKEIKLPFGFIKRPPVLNGNILYVGLSYRDTKDVWNGIEMKDKGSVLAVDLESGEILWRRETEGWVMTALSLIDDCLIYGGYDSSLHCLDINTQIEKWAFNAGGEIMATPAFQDTSIVLGTLEGRIFGIGLKGGNQLWSHYSGSNLKATPIIDNHIVTAHFDDELVGLDLSNGNMLYNNDSNRDGTSGSPAVTDNTLFSFDKDGIFAMNIQTGELVWQVEMDKLPRVYTKGLKDIGDMVINNAILYVPFGKRLLAISLSTDQKSYPQEIKWLVEDDDDQLIDPIGGGLYSGIIEDWYNEDERERDLTFNESMRKLPIQESRNIRYKQKYTKTTLERQYTVKDGLFDGACKEWYPSGQLEMEMQYKNGVPDGVYVEYYESGQKQYECTYIPENENTIISINDYYPRHGKYTEWYENGQIAIEGEFLNGYRFGKYDRYYDTGQPKLHSTYKWGQLVDLYTSWHQDGSIKSEIDYGISTEATTSKEMKTNLEREAMLQDIYAIGSDAAAFWRKPIALGGGARDFTNATDITTFGYSVNNTNGTYVMSNITASSFTLTGTGPNEGLVIEAIVTKIGISESPTITTR